MSVGLRLLRNLTAIINNIFFILPNDGNFSEFIFNYATLRNDELPKNVHQRPEPSLMDRRAYNYDPFVSVL